MANALVKEHVAKIFRLSKEMAFSLAQIVFRSDFLAQIRNQRTKIDPCAKFQSNWTKNKGSRVSTSNDAKNCLMTSYTRVVMMSLTFSTPL